MTKGILRIGNAQGFWGDRGDAPATLAAQQPDLDYLTLDYLAEVSMSILAAQKQRDPTAGFTRDFVESLRALALLWAQRRAGGHPLRVVTNAGGMNPRGCAEACAAVLRDAGCKGLRIGVVSGDDVLPILRERGGAFANLDNGRQLGRDLPLDALVTAHAYIGAAPIVEALAAGADLVVTGRVADPSLTVGPCVHHFGWSVEDFDRVAGATVAGHLIECGTQVTGGISTDWLNIPGTENLGYPVVEVSADGGCVVTKPASTGGRVDERTVKEQLVYEIGDPGAYLSPDATVSLLSIKLGGDGRDRVRVTGAKGSPPPPGYKVSATFRNGFRASGTLTIFGRDAVAKAKRCADVVRARLHSAGGEPEQWLDECLGANAAAPVGRQNHSEMMETVLRITVADRRREVVERFTRELMPLVTSGPQGITGYAEGRPRVHEVYGYWPCLIDRKLVTPRVECIEV